MRFPFPIWVKDAILISSVRIFTLKNVHVEDIATSTSLRPAFPLHHFHSWGLLLAYFVFFYLLINNTPFACQISSLKWPNPSGWFPRHFLSSSWCIRHFNSLWLSHLPKSHLPKSSIYKSWICPVLSNLRIASYNYDYIGKWFPITQQIDYFMPSTAFFSDHMQFDLSESSTLSLRMHLCTPIFK